MEKVIIIAGIFVLILIAGTNDMDAELEEIKQYCKMVELNKRDTDNGWQDYKGIYEEQCK